MRASAILPTFLLLPLCDFASCVPLLLQPGTSEIDIWVTASNTLNATTWNNVSHDPLRVATKPSQVSHPEESDSTTRLPDQTTPTDGVTRTDVNSTSLNSTNLNKTSLNGTDLNNTSLNGTNLNSTNLNSTNLNSTNLNSTNLNSTNLSVTNQSQPLTNATHTGSLTSGNSSTSGNSTHLSVSNTTATNPSLSQNDTALRSVSSSNTAVELAAGTLPITIVNKFPSSNIKVYISGLDPNGALIMLGQNGAWEYPTTTSGTPVPIAADVALPLGPSNTTKTFTLPGYIESARIWIADGGLKFFVVATPNGPGLVQPASSNPKDANAEVNYAFAELSWAAKYGIYADVTNVDFVGLPLGIQLVQSDNKVLSVPGTPSDAAPRLCKRLIGQAKVDGRPWDKLCARSSSGKLVRVLAPSNFVASQSHAFGDYFSRYVSDVWEHYRHNDLIINTQTSPGNVTCRVRGDSLQCAGDNRGYGKPDSSDILGCNSGPFAIQAGDNSVHYAVVPRLCAAFNRATLLIPGGNVQPGPPPSKYYHNENRPAHTRPKNCYSQFVHEMEVGGKGYAFSYDDVAPDVGDDQSGLVGSMNPKALKVIVGGT